MPSLFGDAYAGRTVLVTGHTGFKGSWLTAWLLRLGARVVGFSLPELPTTPNNFELAGLGDRIVDLRGDVRRVEDLTAVIADHAPDCVFHLAGQSIVLTSVEDPVGTLATNAMGTVHLLEAIRTTGHRCGVVSVTTDKVYADRDWVWGYREPDALGGKDPYSASKAMAEQAVEAYRHTFFPPAEVARHGVAVATVRAGNVIGGGDFATHRLVPDCMRALMAGEPIGVRIPTNVRPWQHVLVPLSGYLQLGARLLTDGGAWAEAWNFGPPEVRGIPAGQVAERLIELWGEGEWVHINPDLPQVESMQIRLSWEKAAARLAWDPVYDWDDALAEIVAWFKAYQAGEAMGAVLDRHIAGYVDRARERNVAWTGGI